MGITRHRFLNWTLGCLFLSTAAFRFLLIAENNSNHEGLEVNPEQAQSDQSSSPETQKNIDSAHEGLLSAPEKTEKKGDDKTKGKKEEKESPHKWTGTFGFLSDYRSRGISQNFRRPCVQGEFRYEHASGLYFRSWGSNVDGTGHFLNNTSLEWDFYLGYKHKTFIPLLEFEVGLLYYYFPGGRELVPRNVSYNTLEFYYAFNYKGLQFKLSLTTNDYFGVNSSAPPINWDLKRTLRRNGHSYASPYLEINYEHPFFFEKTKIGLHVGYQAVRNYSQLNYFDWLVTLSREFKWFDITINYVSTNARRAYYKVPDNSYHERRKDLGGAACFIGVSRSF